jgi:pantoate--beta-alanine ligase
MNFLAYVKYFFGIHKRCYCLLGLFFKKVNAKLVIICQLIIYSNSFDRFYHSQIMQVIYTAQELENYLGGIRKTQKSLGLVPTMGALHYAHIALAKSSMAQNHATMVTIFVNPTQFNNAEDLAKYPKRLDQDLQQLRQAGVQSVFIPKVEAIYGQEVTADDLNLKGLDKGMEGDYRPGHFPGVATVIKRFFELIQPTRAYFGEKDYQQLRVIEHITQRFNLGVEVIGCPTERTPEGLAMSSRNYRLNEQGLQDALIIYQNLVWAAKNYRAMTPKEVKQHIKASFDTSPLNLEYVEIANPVNMAPLSQWTDAPHARLFLAAFCQGVRLIDNYRLF